MIALLSAALCCLGWVFAQNVRWQEHPSSQEALVTPRDESTVYTYMKLPFMCAQHVSKQKSTHAHANKSTRFLEISESKCLLRPLERRAGLVGAFCTL